jgi:hypothetical protein
MPIATGAAILGAAAIGAGAGILGASKAAKAQKSAAAQATAVQQQQLGEQTREYEQNRADLAPWRSAGTVALGQLANLTSGDPATVTKQLTSDPGYSFGINQGVRALDSSASARGGVLSGGAMKALTRYGQDYAGTKLNESFNRLSTIAGLGTTANGQQLGASANYMAGQQAGANNIAGNIQAAGNATASQYAATANAVGGLAGQVGQYYALKDLMPSANPGGAMSYNLPSNFFQGQPVQGFTGNDDYSYG